MDRLSQERRSWLMARVRSTDTSPELLVRKLVWGLGYRYRLHVSKLPGRPDIVVSRWRKIIEVRGCFWHRHGCKLSTMPKTRVRFWHEKFLRNVERDKKNLRSLRRDGWSVLVVWQCSLKDIEKAKNRIHEFLESKI